MTERSQQGALAADEMTDEDAANIGRALMERLPKGYSWSNCPTEIVTDLDNETHDLKELLREARSYVYHSDAASDQSYDARQEMLRRIDEVAPQPPKPAPVVHVQCDKSPYCLFDNGHDGGCDDLPF